MGGPRWAYATKGLQSPITSVADCTDLIEGLKVSNTTSSNIGNDFDKVMRLGDTSVPSTLGKLSPVTDNSDIKNIWNDIIDIQVMMLNTCFKVDIYGFMRAAAACLPCSNTFGNKALLQPACTHFSITVEDAQHEMFVQQLKRKVTVDKAFPSLC